MNRENLRRDRKQEHIEHYLKSSHENDTLFHDIYIEHNSLPEVNFDEIDAKVNFLGRMVGYPIIINAMTGGTDFSREINRKLSNLAGKYKLAMAVGSQTIALTDGDSHKSFQIVREGMGKEGLVLANLSGHASVEEAKYAISILDANAIQLHLNPAQELAMEEGDRNFKGVLENIEKIVLGIKKPVIIKEVGFGISKAVAQSLYNIGVRYIDISGTGGTNFIEIEDRRNEDLCFQDIYSWGIPTALSLIQCKSIGQDLKLISSGGIKTSLDILKSLIIGADMVGLGGVLLRKLLEEGYEEADRYIESLVYKLKVLMLLTGSNNIEELRKVPYKTKGELKDLLE